MTAYRFPEDRKTYLYSGPGEPIRQPGYAAITIYLDKACTQIAAIANTNTVAVAGSVIYPGDDGLLPEFLGPDDVLVLWGKPVEGLPFRLTAQTVGIFQGGDLPSAGTAQSNTIAIDTDGVPYFAPEGAPTGVEAAIVFDNDGTPVWKPARDLAADTDDVPYLPYVETPVLVVLLESGQAQPPAGTPINTIVYRKI